MTTKKLGYRDALAAVQKGLPSLSVDDMADALIERFSYEEIIDLQLLLNAHRKGVIEQLLKEQKESEARASDGGAA